MLRRRLTMTLGLALLASICFAGALFAGVVFEVETSDHTVSPAKKGTVVVSVSGVNMAMSITDADRSSEGQMIFRGDRSEMVIVDHRDRSYMVVDEAAVEAIANQINPMIEEALKSVPADQRAQVEKMMKERMGGASAAPAKPQSEFRKTSETTEINGYPVVRYDVFEGDRKVREMWISEWKHIDGSEDGMAAFEAMADFTRKVIESLGKFGGGAQQIGSQFEIFDRMQQLGGFPVRTRELGEDGALVNESTLKTSQAKAIDTAAFEPPSGYKPKSMFGM